jgi:molybdopterin synthase sulfur carrier subunit
MLQSSAGAMSVWIESPVCPMARVVFTENLQRHVATPPCEVAGETVRAVLDAIFTTNPRARSYILDEHGAVRKHIAVFVNGTMIHDRDALSDPVSAEAEVFVMQALSGG